MTKRWINTRVVWDKDGNEIVVEGYLYEGAMALAHNQASTEQAAFKFWETDGSTQVAATDTNPTLEVDTIYIFHTEIENNGDIAEDSLTYEFQYQLNGGGWIGITGSSLAVQTANPTGISDGTATTSARNLTSANTFQAGEESEDGVTAAMAVTNGNYTDHLFGFTIIADQVVNGDALDFRPTFNNYTVLDVYNVNASSTVNEAVSGRIMGSLAGDGGLAGIGGLIG